MPRHRLSLCVLVLLLPLAACGGSGLPPLAVAAPFEPNFAPAAV